MLLAKKKAFVPFVTAGHPDLERTKEIVLELASIGADLIEIGIPFSDPVADGPVIQRSSFAALRHNYRMSDYLQLVRDIRSESDVELIFMTYLNPVLKFGYERLNREASKAGLNGLLISDLTPEEYQRMEIAEEAETLDTVFLVAPTSPPERIKKICSVTSGFVYLVARTGVTGKQTSFNANLASAVRVVRSFTDLPVAVGFGIRTSQDVSKVWETADAAVVGSAIVEFIEENKNSRDLAGLVGSYVQKELIP